MSQCHSLQEASREAGAACADALVPGPDRSSAAAPDRRLDEQSEAPVMKQPVLPECQEGRSKKKMDAPSEEGRKSPTWQERLTVFDTRWSSSPLRLYTREDQELLQSLMLTAV